MGTHRAGRIPKTVAELERTGTFRKDRHGDRKNPEPTAGRPESPTTLDETAQAEWDRMIWAFEDMGMLHKVDAFAVHQYCRLYAETERVAEQQSDAKESLTRLEENQPDPQELSASDRVAYFTQLVTLHKVISKCTDQLRSGRMAIRQYLVEFGLTPASRGRIKLPKQAEKVDDFTAFQRKRAG